MESYSEGEDEPVSALRRLPSCTDVPDDGTAPVAAVEIRSLIERKEELERRQRKQDRHRQRVQVSRKRKNTYIVRSSTLIYGTDFLEPGMTCVSLKRTCATTSRKVEEYIFFI